MTSGTGPMTSSDNAVTLTTPSFKRSLFPSSPRRAPDHIGLRANSPMTPWYKNGHRLSESGVQRTVGTNVLEGKSAEKAGLRTARLIEWHFRIKGEREPQATSQ